VRGITEIFDAMSESGAPFSLAFVADHGGIETHVGGYWPSGRPVKSDDYFYAASLAKQVTGAAVAVLARQGLLLADHCVAHHLPGLGAWAASVTIGQLLHHVSGLVPAGNWEAGGADWTNGQALELLRGGFGDIGQRGAYAYSNVGYVLLARIVESVSGLAFSDFVATYLFGPLAIQGMTFSEAPLGPESEQWHLLGDTLPLSSGDGGLWTTAGAFAQWLDCQNRDLLEIGGLVSQAGRLSDGTLGDYGWGIGLRGDKHKPSFVHAGNWPGAGAKAIRQPGSGLSLVMLGAGEMAPAVAGWTDKILTCLRPSR